MAGHTAINYAAMIKHGRHPRGRAMAIITLIATGKMLGWLARCHATVMATVADAEHLGVIHSNGRAPGIDAMAGIAVIGGGNMIRWLACRLLPIMTVVAITDHFSMIYTGDR